MFLARFVGLGSLIILILLQLAPAIEAAPELELSAPACNEIIQELMPCVGFVKKGGSSAPTGACCSGVKDLSNIAETDSDRQAICHCIKKVLPAVGDRYDPSRIPLLPKKCSVSIKFPPLDSKTDCTKV
ncbi:non-specific lipid-transfer protein-like [Punica granatum]|uniref:Non-specific lipid-transfer protein n=1 Tax=Punica granatum TaxID=22663 RepID=A0A6P8DC54_PUNGR|nr:non-specific lipid-transfer protein-like [Punica granatum]